MIINPTFLELKTIKGIIYKIQNLTTKQIYIGKSKNSFVERYGGNWWLNKHINDFFLKSINKYGHSNFSISILEQDVLNEDKLNELEIFHIKKNNSLYPNGYNFSEGGNLIYTTGEIASSLAKKRCQNLNYRKQLVDRIKNNGISEQCTKAQGEWLKNRTKEVKDKFIYSRKGKDSDLRKKWKVTKPDGIELIVDGLSTFCKKENLNFNTMYRSYERGTPTRSGWKVELLS